MCHCDILCFHLNSVQSRSCCGARVALSSESAPKSYWRNCRLHRSYIRCRWEATPPGLLPRTGQKAISSPRLSVTPICLSFLCELQSVEVCRKSPEWAGAICFLTFYRRFHRWHFTFDADAAVWTWISERDKTRKVRPTTAVPTTEISFCAFELLKEERKCQL